MTDRDWSSFNNRKDLELRSSKETLKYFEKSNDLTFERNLQSVKYIEELEYQRDQLIALFESKYNITFDEAKAYVENSDHKERDFNLEEYNEIINLTDKIDGEKFFIYQRNKLIRKNKEVIHNINNKIEENKKEK